jgi:phthiocerol/phenolphthiocerol synthesis type-I polyketide synthase E
MGYQFEYILPNGMQVTGYGRPAEVDFIYRESFEDHIYFINGIRLHGHPTVFDVGANIGLFSLYLQTRHPEAAVFSFEPSVQLFELLRANTARCSLRAPRIFNIGLSHRNGAAEYMFYPHSPGSSGYHYRCRKAEDASQILQNQFERTVLGSQVIDEYLTSLKNRLKDGEVTLTPVARLSSVLRSLNIPSIDLLKIDVEQSETDMLDGIDDNNWNRIGQVVLEVHGRKLLDQITLRLERQRFRVTVEDHGFVSRLATVLRKYDPKIIPEGAPMVEELCMYLVYAIKPAGSIGSC